MTDTIHVGDSPELSRYEVFLNGDPVGFAEYRVREGEIEFPDTEVDPQFGGRGLGSALIKAALDDVRSRYPDRRVVPTCPFVAGFIARHPEYQDLLAGE